MNKYDPKRDGITQSILMGFLNCRVFSKLSLEGWTPLKTGAALQFGTMAHDVLEFFYTQRQLKKLMKPPSEEEVLERINVVANAWTTTARGMRAGPEDLQQLEVNAAKLEAVLPDYFKFWGKEDFETVQWVALEEEFAVDFFGWLLKGKKDGLYRQKDKKLSILETKTKGRIEQDAIEELLAFDFQTDYYNVATELQYKEQATMARYNIIRNPGNKLGKDEKLSEFTERIRKEVKEDPTKYFMRYRINKPKKDLAEFKAELRLKLQDFVDWYAGKLPTYKNENACTSKFGPCRFLPICARGDYSHYYKRDRIFEELSGPGKKVTK
jgi:hypothetical protein